MSANFGGPNNSQDFDINLAPIIDCFTVLIAFMLVSASFISIGILDAGVAAGGATAAEGTPPPVQITVELNRDQSVAIKLAGKATSTQSIRAKDGKRDLAEVNRQLAAIKGKWPSVEAATLTAESNVEYREVIETMEMVRKTQPAVLLGGF